MADQDDDEYLFNQSGMRRSVRSIRWTEGQSKNVILPVYHSSSGGVAWHRFINNTAETIPACAIMAMASDPQIEMAGSDIFQVIYKCSKPSTTFRQTAAVNSRAAVLAGESGFCCFEGPVWIAYDSGTPARGEGWGPKPGQWTLSKGFPCTTLVDGIVDSTNKLLLGTLSPIGTLLCKATADNAAGSLATDTTDYKIQSGTAGSEADAGFTTQPAIYAREATSNNEFFTATWINNTWYADIRTGQITMYKAKLNGALADTDANATIDNVTCFGGGTAPSPTSAANTLDLAGSDNDDCVIVKDGTGYYLFNVMHHAC